MYLRKQINSNPIKTTIDRTNCLIQGDAIPLIDSLPDGSIQCVVTSTPYWALRIYDEFLVKEWADGEVCTFGLEQTPESFIRHSVETLYHIKRNMTTGYCYPMSFRSLPTDLRKSSDLFIKLTMNS